MDIDVYELSLVLKTDKNILSVQNIRSQHQLDYVEIGDALSILGDVGLNPGGLIILGSISILWFLQQQPYKKIKDIFGSYLMFGYYKWGTRTDQS